MSEVLYQDMYEFQLQEVEAALTKDPENKELVELKNNLKQVLIRTQDAINSQLEADKNAEVEAMKTKIKKEKDQWTDDLSFINVIAWKTGDDCQAVDPVDGTLHDAKIVNINNMNRKVIVMFKGDGRIAVTKLDLLLIPKNGEERGYKTFSAEDMKFITTYRKMYLERKKREAEIEREAKRKTKGCELNDKNTVQKRACKHDIRSCGE